MSPPSRGSWNDGALAPSARAGRAAAFRFDLAPAAGFNVLEAGTCDALVCLFFGFLLDLVADGALDFEAGLLADAFDAARVVVRAEGLSDFLRVFLDIRLPFVAFRGSIIGVLRQLDQVDCRAGQFDPSIMLKRISTRHPASRVVSSRMMNGDADRSLQHSRRRFYNGGSRRTICKYEV
jgi:hypothetical protein